VKAVIALVLAALVLAGLLALTVLGAVLGSSSTTTAAIAVAAYVQCQADQVGTLTPHQARNAAGIVQVVGELTNDNTRAEQIALMTALTESDLHDLGPRPGNDGSVGLFQQRAGAGWASSSEEQNLIDSTTMFTRHLLAVPHWQTMKPWVAAQAVQRSAFANGSNYKRHWAMAGAILAGTVKTLTAADCGGGIGTVGTGRYGLPASYQIPSSASPQEVAVLDYALSKLGDAYVWGAAGPTDFDCSGLTMMAWRQAGVELAHYTVSQMHEGTPVSYGSIQPADLVLTPGIDPPGAGLPGHVGLYLGDGLVESALDPQEGVVVQTYAAFVSGGLDAIVQP
jgi:cell wall-associated NlpC family hydrolase